ncbi:WD40 repeat domain-containing protein [Roseofilum sp. Guam]|uniref:WD40 repeat domain-containing protein n=1 Tax=Roseofilum sp. Guam TaxID=2821502 RepID=UPI001B1E546F|nr:WD40 repeat domain-containing protein [Roseofilum sp. Guam]MBP0026776.1 WD40 repeat domain-containing protein [Roseofilum sp. Guam]
MSKNNLCVTTLGDRALKLGDIVETLSLTPDGKLLVCSYHDARIKVFDWRIGQEVCLFRGHIESIRSLAITPDSQRIIVLGYHPTMNKRTMRFWNLQTGQQVESLCIAYSGYVRSFLLTPNGRNLIIDSNDSKITYWSVETGQLMGTLEDSDSFTIRILKVFDMSGISLLIASDAGRTLTIWNLNKGQLLHILEGHKEEGLCADISPDGEFLVSGGKDAMIKVWDVESGEEIYTFKGHSDYITSIAFSPNEKAFASASWDKTIKIWNLDTEEKIYELHGHTDYVTSIAFSLDGQYLMSGSWDGTIKVWDVDLAI